MFCFHVILFFLSQIDEDLTARINMADAKFSFQEKGRIYYPAWMSPEGKEKT
jgi:integrin-linked kinase